jgi:hypothetical protein
MQKARNSNANANVPFYLNASVLLARTAAGIPDSDGDGLLQAVEIAEQQGMASAIAVYPEWQHIVALRAEIELAQDQYAAAVADAQIALERAKLEAVDPNSSAWVGEAAPRTRSSRRREIFLVRLEIHDGCVAAANQHADALVRACNIPAGG